MPLPAAGNSTPIVWNDRVFVTCPIDGGAATYNITIQAAATSTYMLNAVPTGAQTGDKCGTLTFSNTGVKNVVGASAGVTWQDCW